MTSTATRFRRNTLAILLVLSTGGLLSGCAASAGQAPEPAASATEAGTAAVTEAASPSAADEPAGPIPENFGVPAPAGKPVISPKGSYMQSTISDDDPAMQLNPAILHESAAVLDFADIEAAQRTMIKFMAEEVIDSRLNGDDHNFDAWWESHKYRIAPDYQGRVYQHLVDGDSFVLREKWQKEEFGDSYDYLTSPDKVRIYDRTITPTIVWSPQPGTIAVEAQVTYIIPVTPNVGLIGSGIQSTSGTLSLAVSKDAAGNWLIDGFQHDINTTQG